MPGSVDLKTFLEERFLLLDPDTDLSEGSPAQLTVIDPTVRRFLPDPFEMDLPTFIKARLRQAFPNLQTEDGDALADFLVKPMEALLDPFVREVQFLRNNQSLANPELLAPAEADSLMGNIFVRRSRGQKAVGIARMYFSSPTALVVSVGNNFYTVDGLNYLPSTPQSISAESMLFNQSGNLFYFDVALTAETEGDEYNIDVETIVGVSNIPSTVRVTNLRPFTDGLPEESTIGYVERGETSLTERSMVIPRGALARLFDVFGDLQHLQVVGFNDPEMLRDIISGGGLGPVVVYSTTGFSQDDGNGDTYSSVWEDNSVDFVSTIGPIGVIDNFTLSVKGVDYQVVAVINAHMLRVVNEDGTLSSLPDDLPPTPYYIRKNILTLSGIPGGIVMPQGPRGEIVLADNEVHIGGCSDFYVRGITLESAEQVIQSLSDELPLTEGKDLSVLITGFPPDIVRVPSTTTSFVDRGVKVGHSLVIEGAGVSVAGSYQILKVAPSGLTDSQWMLQVYPAPGSPFDNLTYKIVDELDVDLNEPKNVRDTGIDLKTVMGSRQVSTTSEVDFSAIGGQPSDTLRVLGESLNAGDYGVEKITGTANKLLVLTSETRRTSNTEPWMLFKKQEGIHLPLLRIKTVDILDSALNPTGETLPYADPVDIQSSSFSNAGVGRKKEVTNAKIGILGTVDFAVMGAAAALNGKRLLIHLNGGPNPETVNFSGITTFTDVINQINAAIPAIAASYDVGIQKFLCVRSTTRFLQVSPYGSANPFIGFSVTEMEDSRQVVSSGTDWTQSDIQALSDSVYVMTGDNIGFWFLRWATPTKLYICQVDDSGRVILPLPSLNTTVRVGSRSFGNVRCYFLEPTSFEVLGSYRKGALGIGRHAANLALGNIVADEDQRAEFALDTYGDGKSFLRFFPDPELSFQLLPTTSEEIPNNLSILVANTGVVESVNSPVSGDGKYSRAPVVNFLLREVLPGDVLEITYQPIQGTADIRSIAAGGTIDYVAAEMLGKTLTFSLENGPDKTVTFSNQVDGPTKLVGEINAQLGATIAYIETDTVTSKQYLRLETDFPFTVRSSTSVKNANSKLGLTPKNNDAAAKGEWTILDVGEISGAVSNPARLTLDVLFSVSNVGPSQHFVIRRPGLQRVSSTEMANNKEGALYYADIELVSDGVGDDFNIGPNLQLEVTHHRSDGYRLYTEDENLSFSMAEALHTVISRRMLSVGETDSPLNMRQLSLTNIQLNYDRAPLVEEIQNFAQSELDRVLTANILVRHLQPHFIQLVMNYSGGSRPDIVISDVTDLIEGLLPDEALEASAVGEIPRKRGATSVDMPITLVGIVHYSDRRVRAIRSQNYITAGRLATFIPDVLSITRDGVV